MYVSFEFALKFERFRRKNCVSFSPLFFLYLKFNLCLKAKSNKFAVKVHNMNSYQYLNNMLPWGHASNCQAQVKAKVSRPRKPKSWEVLLFFPKQLLWTEE